MFQALLSDPLTLTLTLLVLLAIILVIAFVRANGRDKSVTARLNEMEGELSALLNEARSENDVWARQGREELSKNLIGMGDSVSRVMNEMARTQQNQLDAFSGQLVKMQRVDESRMDDLRATVEARLAAYETRMDRIGDVLDDKLDKNEQRIERMRQTVERQMDKMQQENGQRLEEMRQTVDEKLNATLDKRLGESFRLVSDRLDQVYRGLGEMQSLASGVGDLKRVLTNVRTRGLLGEIQLGTLLAQIMVPEQYDRNVIIRKDQGAVDFAVRLPAREDAPGMLLPIDAGFPQEIYQRMLDAFDGGNQALIDQLSQELESALTARAREISERFLAPPVTTGFAILFLPVEGLYAEALRRPGLSDRLQREYGVTLTGPATLTALLNSLQMGFKTLALEKRSNEVWSLLGAVRGEFTQFADALARTQKKIRQASESIEDAARKSRTIEKRLRGVKRLDAEEVCLLDDAPEDAYGNDWD